MLIKFATKLVGGIIKKIISVIVVIGLIVYFVFNGDKLSWLLNKASDIAGTEVKVEMQSDDLGEVSFTINDKTKKQIDAWLAANNYNEFGDPLGTVYTGGTPLFDEQTGETTDRYEYLVHKYPELKQLF